MGIGVLEICPIPKNFFHTMLAGDRVNRKNHFARLPARRFDAIVLSQYQHADS
jgi:hypothetical protein